MWRQASGMMGRGQTSLLAPYHHIMSQVVNDNDEDAGSGDEMDMAGVSKYGKYLIYRTKQALSLIFQPHTEFEPTDFHTSRLGPAAWGDFPSEKIEVVHESEQLRATEPSAAHPNKSNVSNQKNRLRHNPAAIYFDLEAAEGGISEGDEDEEDLAGKYRHLARQMPNLQACMTDFIDQSTLQLSRHSNSASLRPAENRDFRDEGDDLRALANHYQLRAPIEYAPKTGEVSSALWGQQELSVTEQDLRAVLLRTHHTEAVPAVLKNSWARLRIPFGDKVPVGQLAFADSDNSALVLVPFDEEKARKLGKLGWQFHKMPVKHGKRLDHGLTPAVPTVAEVELWDSSDRDILRLTAGNGSYLAFSPGFRVVEKSGKEGYITSIDRVDDFHSNITVRRSFDGRRILQKDPNFYALLTAPCVKPGDEFIARSDNLEHHILRIPSQLQILDRVVTVIGPGITDQEPVRGRVRWINEHKLDHPVTICIGEGQWREFPMSTLRRDFQLGDLVEVTAGHWKGEQGIIVNKTCIIHTDKGEERMIDIPAGGVEIFRTRSKRVNDIVDTGVEKQRKGKGNAVFTLHEDESMLKVLEVQLEFSNTDFLGSTTSSIDQAEMIHEIDIKEYNMRQPAKRHARLLGTAVMITHPHRMKGTYGVIVDTHDVLVPGPLAAGGSVWDPVIGLTVRGESSNQVCHEVVHRWSRRPLHEADLLNRWAQQLGWNWPATSDSTLLPPENTDPEWAPVPEQSIVPPSMPLLTSDYDGTWLHCPDFVGKRLDVVILPKTSGRASGIQLSLARQTGYIELESALSEKTLKDRKTILVRVGEACKRVRIEYIWLMPCREEGRDKITMRRGRVVVTGPDIQGDDSHRGEYAQAWPGCR
ncbi:hypothetical protein B0H11DRAFT_2188789 [Mycena galericulata]|nr:hypothetical protein B0H11DRAFT_2188789 [Mycena galericulata]